MEVMRLSIRTMVLATLTSLSLAPTLAACSGSDSSAATDTGVIPAPATAGAEVVFVDVRTAEEYVAGHLEGAVNINVEGPDFESQISALDKDVPYIVYCRSGRRSALAVEAMTAAGFTDLTDAGAIEQAAADYQLPIVES